MARKWKFYLQLKYFILALLKKLVTHRHVSNLESQFKTEFLFLCYIARVVLFEHLQYP